MYNKLYKQAAVPIPGLLSKGLNAVTKTAPKIVTKTKPKLFKLLELLGARVSAKDKMRALNSTDILGNVVSQEMKSNKARIKAAELARSKSLGSFMSGGSENAHFGSYQDLDKLNKYQQYLVDTMNRNARGYANKRLAKSVTIGGGTLTLEELLRRGLLGSAAKEDEKQEAAPEIKALAAKVPAVVPAAKAGLENRDQLKAKGKAGKRAALAKQLLQPQKKTTTMDQILSGYAPWIGGGAAIGGLAGYNLDDNKLRGTAIGTLSGASLAALAKYLTSKA